MTFSVSVPFVRRYVSDSLRYSYVNPFASDSAAPEDASVASSTNPSVPASDSTSSWNVSVSGSWLSVWNSCFSSSAPYSCTSPSENAADSDA